MRLVLRTDPWAGCKLLKFMFKYLLEFRYFDKVLHSGYHPSYLGRIFHFFRAANFAQTQGLNCAFLPFRTVDNAFHQLDFDLCHTCLTVKYLLQADTTLLRNLQRVAHLS